MLQPSQDSASLGVALSEPISQADLDYIQKTAGEYCCEYIQNIHILLAHPSVSYQCLKTLAATKPYALREILQYAPTAVYYINTHALSIHDIAAISQYPNTRNLVQFLMHPSIFDDLYTKYGIKHQNLLWFSNDTNNLDAFSAITFHKDGIRYLLDHNILSSPRLLEILRNSGWTVLFSLAEHSQFVHNLVSKYNTNLGLIIAAIKASLPFDGFGAIAKNPQLLLQLDQEHNIQPNVLLELAIRNCMSTEYLFTKLQDGFQRLIEHPHISAATIIQIAYDVYGPIQELCENPEAVIYYLDTYDISLDKLSRPFLGRSFGFSSYDLRLLLKDEKEQIESIYQKHRIHPKKWLSLLHKSHNMSLRDLLDVVKKLEKAGPSAEDIMAVFYSPMSRLDLILKHYKALKSYSTCILMLDYQDLEALNQNATCLSASTIILTSNALNITPHKFISCYSDALLYMKNSQYLSEFLKDEFIGSHTAVFKIVLRNYTTVEYILQHNIVALEYFQQTHILQLQHSVETTNIAIRDKSLYRLSNPPHNLQINDIIKIAIASNFSIVQIKSNTLLFESLIHFFNIYLKTDITQSAFKVHCSTFHTEFRHIKEACTKHYMHPAQCWQIMLSTQLDMNSILYVITQMPRRSKKCNIADCKYMARSHPAVFRAVHDNFDYVASALSSSTFYLHDLLSYQYNQNSIIAHINSHDVIEYMKQAQQTQKELDALAQYFRETLVYQSK